MTSALFMGPFIIFAVAHTFLHLLNINIIAAKY